MRIPSKNLVVRLSLLIVLAMPTMARAVDGDENVKAPTQAEIDQQKKDEKIEADRLAEEKRLADEKKIADDKAAAAKNAKYLDLTAAKAAFGPEFSVGKDGDTVNLYGGTSEECSKAFTIENEVKTIDDIKVGQFKIKYDGSNAKCLKFEDALKDQPNGSFRPLWGDKLSLIHI